MSRLCLVVAAGAVLLSACGSDSGPAQITFKGNSTCPTTITTSTGAQPSPYSPMPPGTNGDPVGQAIDEMPHDHVSPPTRITYNHNPPTSGCHYNLGPDSGATAPIVPGSYNQHIDAEFWVHNLEHGYVAVLYNCPSGCDADFQQLVAWRKRQPPDPQGQTCQSPIGYPKIIVLPWTMDTKFAVVSWDWYQGFATLDIGAIQKFYDNHNGHSPEGVCTQ